jgi:hypothetical protein
MPHPSGSINPAVVAHGTGVFQLRVSIVEGRVRVRFHQWPDCTCGCRGGWRKHLVYVELLRLRVQTWQPHKGVT